jgi:hypothetical protein
MRDTSNTYSYNAIIGKWTKISNLECSRMYPDDLEFNEKRSYRGLKGLDKNKFTLWDVGSYEILSDHQIKISTANDEVIIYTFSIKDNILNFIDENNCQFQYQKSH